MENEERKIVDEQPAVAGPFRLFLLWDAIVCVISIIALVITYVLFHAPVLLVMSVEIALYMGLLAWAWRRAARGDLNRATAVIVLGILAIALTLGLMAPEAAAVAVLLTVLSVMVGLPYMSRLMLRRLIFAVVAVSAVIASVQLSEGLASLDEIPTWIIGTIIGVGVPVTSGLIFLLGLQYCSHLNKALDQTRASNIQLSDTMRLLQHSRRRVVNAQEQLRREVAAQLHGTVQNRLLVVSQWLRMARRADAGDKSDSGSTMDKALGLVEEINEGGLREILRRLHPFIIRMSLQASLQSLGDRFQGDLEVTVHAQSDDDSKELWAAGLPEPLRLAIYRVAEEAMNNVVKHAGATKVDIFLRRRGIDAVSLTVSDDGRGFDVEQNKQGFGMLTMEDHCGAEEGTLAITSDVGKGTKVTAFFPIPVEPGLQNDQATATA
jgi:signal transduction histidine kinase